MSETKKRGRFIAFEGGEGAGKSTQAKLLADALRSRGFTVDVTREPGGTPGAEAIRKLLLHPPGEGDAGWGAKAEALLFAAARADHVERRILPAVEAGNWVVCDRFVDSSRAYQGGAGGLGDQAIVALHDFGSDGLRPDLTILLQADPDKVAERLAIRDGTEADAIGGRSAEYHRQVAKRFVALAEADPTGFAVIDGSADEDTVHRKVLEALEPLVAGKAS
ncbi:dTMP kinase [Erythrobacter rubeus]|uniref:Thymidylate kinase n=1 Tax=Erythrobacter rubeus TaxID=2760803 RepID=A0ABR8KQU6_9SPHN|nr:dTMP kinase [Erythrobacter rubeus]MBD2841777.1 dTMP kinase [Erythrobacter rubeus]